MYIVTIFKIMNKFITILMFQHGALKLHALSSYGLDMPLDRLLHGNKDYIIPATHWPLKLHIV